MIFGFAVLILMSLRAYQNAPPIPAKAVAPGGEVVFTAEDVAAGQEVFLKYGLMDNGTIWGHGAYLGPGLLGADAAQPGARTSPERIAQTRFQTALRQPPREREGGSRRSGCVGVQDQPVRRRDRHADASRRQQGGVQPSRSRIGRTTSPTPPRTAGSREARSPIRTSCASSPRSSPGPPGHRRPQRPGSAHSYTNNFPYDPLVGNQPHRWRACSGAPSAWCSCSAASPSCCSPSASSTTSAGTAARRRAAARPASVRPAQITPAQARHAQVHGGRRPALPRAGADRRRASRTTAPSPATSTASTCRLSSRAICCAPGICRR